MTTTIFDARTRTVECSRCGAPIAAARQGGEVACRYCATLNVVATRAFDAREGRALSLADEVARLTRLQAQLEHPLQGHAYDLRRAPAGFAEGDVARPDARDRLRRAWLEAKAATAGPGEPQRRLLWIALALAGAHRKAGDALQARAVLETVIGLLEDAGHRHLARCRLADEALAEGDVAAAEGWLAECDPAPEVIELDGPYRAALARARSAKGEFEGALSVVGRREGDVPLEPSLRLPMAAVRIHSLEALGQLDAGLGSVHRGPRGARRRPDTRGPRPGHGATDAGARPSRSPSTRWRASATAWSRGSGPPPDRCGWSRCSRSGSSCS